MALASQSDCPCQNDKPDPCPTCGATVATGICRVEMFTEAMTTAVMNAIAETEGEPLGLRTATILAAVRDHL
jgi:hypothetical protein